MTANELYRKFLLELSGVYNKEEAGIFTSILFDFFANINRASLLTDPNKIITHHTQQILEENLLLLKEHKPIQYITGEAWFYKLKLSVSPAVLIPRPETEELVEELLLTLSKKKYVDIIDIGTGSGCISIAVKKNRLAVNITAIDISNDALAIAKQNAIMHATTIDFKQLDFLDDAAAATLDKYDVIISNPPYITEDQHDTMDKNVTAYEPHLALFVKNKQPLIFYEKIAAFALKHLNENGMIFLETHEEHANEVASLFDDKCYEVVIKKDMFEKERMVIITRYP